MAADATINIDIMLSNLPKFESDTKIINTALKALGKETGLGMDDAFKAETAKVVEQAEKAKKKIDSSLGKKVEVKAELNAEHFDQETEKVQKKIVRFPKELKTKIVADAETAGVESFEKVIKKLPYEKKVELKAEAKAGEVINFQKYVDAIPKKKTVAVDVDATNAKEQVAKVKAGVDAIPTKKATTIEADTASARSNVNELSSTTENAINKVSSLKEKLSFGAIAGAATTAITTIIGGIGDLVSEGVSASDAMDKFKSTMGFAGFDDTKITQASKSVKKYADDTVYELSDVANTTAQLAANGITNFTELTESAGNLNAVAGGNADTFKSVAMMLTQTAGAGKLTTENWNQLADAIPGASGVLQKAMKDNGAYTGNFRDAMEAGQISSDEFNQAITQLGQNNGAIEAAKSTSTFEGAIGSLQANVVSGIDDIIAHLGKDNLTNAIGFLSDKVKQGFGLIADGFEYLASHKKTLDEIVDSVMTIGELLGATVWNTAKDFISDIGEAFGVIDDKAKLTKDPLEVVNDVLKKVADHKNEIELLGKAIVVMFAVKKGYEFITMMTGAIKSVMAFTAVQKLMNAAGGISLPGKKSKGSTASSTASTVADAADIAEDVIGKKSTGKAVAEVGGEAMEALGSTSKFAKIGSGVAKSIPYLSLLAEVPTLLDSTKSTSSKLGNVGGSLGGGAAGAAIGTAILPGIGTAIGGGIGALGGSALGEKLAKDITKGFAKHAPGLKNAFSDVGHTISKALSNNVGSNAKNLSKKYTKEMENLNKILVKKPKNDKDLANQGKQTAKTFEKMGKDITSYYDKKEKSSSKDYDYFVKNGLMSQKEADKQLKKQQQDDGVEQESRKRTLDTMKKLTKDHYKNTQKIQSGNTKTLQKMEKFYGKSSKEYKAEQNAELEAGQKKYSKSMQKQETSMNDAISKETKIASGKQLDLLEDLKNHKGKLSTKAMQRAILTSKKERDTIIKNAKKTADDSISSADKKYKETVAIADKERYENGTMSKKQYDKVVKQARKERDDAVSAATTKCNKSVKKAQEQHKKVVAEAESQAGQHKGAVSAETGAVKGSWADMSSGMGQIIEGLAHGVGRLLNALNGSWGKGLKSFKWGAHARGTSGLTEDEIALVGEEGFELAHHPSTGIFPIGVNGPEIRPLSAGTSILPHAMSKDFLSMSNRLPAHADGVLGAITGAYDLLKGKALAAESWVSGKVSDVASFVSEGASGMYDTVLDKLGVSDFLKDLGSGALKDVPKGLLDTAKDKITEYMKGFFDKWQEENGGSGSRAEFLKIAEKQSGKPYVWGAEGPDAFDCSGLVKWALSQVGVSFPHYSGDQFNATDRVSRSDTKPGDLIFFGPGGSEHVGIMHDKNKFFAARAPNANPNIGFDPVDGFPEALAGFGRIKQLNDSGGSSAGAPSGSGVNRWRTQLIAALKANGVSTSDAYVNAWLRQIQTESGGNQNAVGGNDGIIAEGNATGLLQVKPRTFAANAFAGHKNIMNVYDNMLAGIHYAKNRYPNMLAYIGQGHGYKDGGEVFGPTNALIGEDPSAPYEIVINPAKNTADALISKAIQARAQYKPASQSTHTIQNSYSNQGNAQDSKTVIELHTTAELDGKKVSKEIAKPVQIELNNLDKRATILKTGRVK